MIAIESLVSEFRARSVEPGNILMAEVCCSKGYQLCRQSYTADSQNLSLSKSSLLSDLVELSDFFQLRRMTG